MTALAVAAAAVALALVWPSSGRRLVDGWRRSERATGRAPGGGPRSVVGSAGARRGGDVVRRVGRRVVSARRGPASRPTPSAESTLPAPLLLDLLAALLESGAAPTPALRMVGRVLSADGDPRASQLLELAVRLEQGVLDAGSDARSLDDARATPASAADGGPGPPDGDPSLTALADALRMAAVAGLPPAALVRRAAAQERRRLEAASRRAVRRLEVLLVLPMGLCLLPAFVLLGIAPVVIDLLTDA